MTGRQKREKGFNSSELLYYSILKQDCNRGELFGIFEDLLDESGRIHEAKFKELLRRLKRQGLVFY